MSVRQGDGWSVRTCAVVVHAGEVVVVHNGRCRRALERQPRLKQMALLRE